MGKCMKSDLGTLFSQVVGKTSYIFIENVPNRFVQSSKELEFISQNRLCWFLFFTSNLLLLFKVVSAESANARWQNFHPFPSVFAYFFQNVQNEEILGSNWGQSNFMTEVGKKGGNVSYYFKSAPKGQKKATSRWVSSTMKVEVSNKYSKVYCCCCHLCSQKKLKIKENEALNQKS